MVNCKFCWCDRTSKHNFQLVLNSEFTYGESAKLLVFTDLLPKVTQKKPPNFRCAEFGCNYVCVRHNTNKSLLPQQLPIH